MDLPDALSQLADIRHHVHRSGLFRGYRAAAAGASGVAAIIAAMIQTRWVPHPEAAIDLYLTVWLSAGLASIGAAALVVIERCRRSGSAVQRELAMHAGEQLMPSLVVGGLVTFILCNFDLNATVLLPGLWPIFLGMGVFASRRLLPRAIVIVGGYYLLAGFYVLAMHHGLDAFDPWVMGTTFAVGQFLAAIVLWWHLERPERVEAFDGIA